MAIRVATDVGGTFTDLVCIRSTVDGSDKTQIITAKVDTTPPQFENGVFDAIASADLKPSEIDLFIHGTTVVINALTERKGAKVGLVTTRGFRDVLEIARGNRPDLFNFRYKKPPPFVPRHLRREITERVDYKGNVETAVALEELDEIAAYFQQEQVEAIAVCFLHSYRNPTHEMAVADRLGELLPGVIITVSTGISREWREYERTSTSVVAAYVQPVARKYLEKLERRLEENAYSNAAYVMRSNGGADTLAAAKSKGLSMVESGPAAGIYGAAALGELIGEPNLIALDIGGTTAKCSLIENGNLRVTGQYDFERTRDYSGYPLLVPVVDIIEIGNGGGSIAWVDGGGKLHVGPKSAGADPGPASYGRGGVELTTTDAHVLTGRIDPANFLGGSVEADVGAAHAAAGRLADRMNVSAEDVALGVLRVANNNMVNALKLVSLNRGYDPRKFSLVAFGGGGGLHGVALARALNIPKVIVPINAAVFSAWGMLLTDLRRDHILSNPMELSLETVEEFSAVLSDLESSARAEFVADGISVEELNFRRILDMRYEGQEHTVKVEAPTGAISSGQLEAIISDFHNNYEREYSYTLPNKVEVVNFHLVSQIPVEKITPEQTKSTGRSLSDCISGEREVDLGAEGRKLATVYKRDLLEPGMKIDSPAIIEDCSTTIIIDSGEGSIDDIGNIHIVL